jgi:hypothetical protein
MINEEKFVALLQKAVKANFAVAREGKSMNAVTRYEDTAESPRAMFYGIMTEYLGAEYTKQFAFNSGHYDYESMMFQYNLLLLSKEPSPRNDDKKMWKRYVNKKKLIDNYIKLNGNK